MACVVWRLTLLSFSVMRSVSASLSMSSVRLVVVPLYAAILWTISTASASRPRPMRYLGDSYRWKTNTRSTNSTIISAPFVQM